jgi:hypothetical protein
VESSRSAALINRHYIRRSLPPTGAFQSALPVRQIGWNRVATSVEDGSSELAAKESFLLIHIRRQTMLQVISPLKGFTIKASDGGIGTVVDFLFDDTSWKVRWLVIDCGTWLTGRKVLIHPSAISRQDLEQQEFVVALTKAQVEGSPERVEDQPVSQQMENQLYAYYGWDPLWGGPNLAALPGAMASPLLAPPYLGLSSTDEAEARSGRPVLRGADPHLRSIVEVTGYRVHALDGEIGHIENLMIDDADWSVHYLIVDTRNWWFGKHVLISPIAVKTVDWFDRHVELDVSRGQVKASPPWDPLVAFNKEYATRLHKHYGWLGSTA